VSNSRRCDEKCRFPGLVHPLFEFQLLFQNVPFCLVFVAKVAEPLLQAGEIIRPLQAFFLPFSFVAREECSYLRFVLRPKLRE
jgi:hypothetical protein